MQHANTCSAKAKGGLFAFNVVLHVIVYASVHSISMLVMKYFLWDILSVILENILMPIDYI